MYERPHDRSVVESDLLHVAKTLRTTTPEVRPVKARSLLQQNQIPFLSDNFGWVTRQEFLLSLIARSSQEKKLS